MAGLEGSARKWVFFWTVFYGAGAPLVQVSFILKNGFLNQYSLADFAAGAALLASVAAIGREKHWGRLLNAIAWGAFAAIFISSLSYFAFILKEQTPAAALYATSLGLPIALSCVALHLRATRG